MRILEIETFGFGGLAHYAFNLSAALAERGHEVTLLTTAGWELAAEAAGGDLPPRLDVVRRLGRVSAADRRRLPAALAPWALRGEAIVDAARAAAFARRLGPDVVHLHSTNPAAIVYLALLRLLRPPLAATAHQVTPHEPIPLERAVYRGIHRLPGLVVAHSRVDRGRLVDELGVDPGRVAVIPHGEYGFFAGGAAGGREVGPGQDGTSQDGHGQDGPGQDGPGQDGPGQDGPGGTERAAEPAEREVARRRLGLEPGDEVALFFGYVREYKGLDVLLAAWPRVVEARPRARLVIAGDPVRLAPARREELAARARRVGAVLRFGYVPFAEVERWFAAADALVMPYREISQSGVLYLALALGVPVVATAVGGLPEVLADGESALLVPPESPDAFAAAVARLLGDPELRRRLARGGRRVAERHAWPAIAERTEAAFRRLVRRP